jgi:putative hydrolase of the HAD superfamily
MTVINHNAQRFKFRPAAVLFDLDNTLYAYDPAHEAALDAVAAKAKSAFGLDEGKFRKAFARARTAIKTRLHGTAAAHNRLLCMQQALELLGLKTQLFMALDFEQTYWRMFLSRAALFPGVKEFLQALRRAGISTCVVTDQLAHIQFRKLIYFGLNDCFDFVVTSEEAGAEKPAAIPFELALAKLETQAKDVFMIGEEAVTDIAGAKALGIVTLQKRHAGVKVFRDERQPDLVFDTFGELEKHLSGYGWLEPELKKIAKQA